MWPIEWHGMSAESSPLYNHVIHNHLTISSYDGLLYISRTSKLNNVINVYKYKAVHSVKSNILEEVFL